MGKSGAGRANAVAPYETNDGGGSVGESKNLGKQMTVYDDHSFAVILVFGTLVRRTNQSPSSCPPIFDRI